MKPVDRARWQRASPYLDAVLDLPAPEREARLRELRSTEPEIAADLDAMLDEHRKLSAEGFLDARPLVEAPSDPGLAGATIGAYRLVSPIGHGGMGTVWLAERCDGRFEGHAALKLLNAALVGRAGEQRFRREGTILARLTHPHIARLIDAGVTAAGQPFLVLEHIDGRHIDRYCDEEHLSIEDRVRLFLDVQAAVAHAHANLIIHRDLKPSNVVVTAAGEVKLLDFGIAKLLADDTGEDATALLTREGEVVLTPKYAAPEQVTRGRITTATDVYALGVLLFELLSGRHPTASSAQTPAEFVKAIADTDPLRLSSAADASGGREDTAAVAVARATTPERLRRALGGDLEIVLAKALKAKPEERYGSVAEFADDLRRVLQHEPISARRDSVGYRTARFVRRHRQGLALTGIAATALVTIVGFYTARLSAERDRARAQALKASRTSELIMGLLAGADPYRSPGVEESNARSILDTGALRVSQQLADEPELRAQLLTVIGRTYERMGYLDKARPVLEQALAAGRSAARGDSATVAQTLNDLGVLQRETGDLRGSASLLRESLATRRRLLGDKDPSVAVTLVELSRSIRDTGGADEAEALAREALAIRRSVFGDEHNETATSKSDLGVLLLRRGDLAGAEPLLRENAATTERLMGANHPNTASAKASLAAVMLARGDAAAAERLLREAAEVDKTVFGPDRPEYAQMLGSLSAAIEAQGRLREAEALLDESLRIVDRQFPADHPRVLLFAINRARIRIKRGHAAETEPVLRRALVARERLYPADDWRVAQARSLLGAALIAQHRSEDAEPLMLDADRVLKAVPGPEGDERRDNRARLVRLYTLQRRLDRAAAFR